MDDSFSTVLEGFNKQFRGYSSFEIDEATAKKQFPIVNKAFNRRWHPADARNQYETAFSPSAWNALPDAEKRQHQLRDCEAYKRCDGDLTTLFPANGPNSKASTGQDENTVTIYNGRDATPKQVGKQIINKLGPVVERQFGITVEEVLTQTPKSHLIQKPTSAEKRGEMQNAEAGP